MSGTKSSATDWQTHLTEEERGWLHGIFPAGKAVAIARRLAEARETIEAVRELRGVIRTKYPTAWHIGELLDAILEVKSDE